MSAMFPDYPKVGLSPVLAGSKNQSGLFIIRKVVEANKLKPEGLAKPVVGLIAKKHDVVPVKVYDPNGLLSDKIGGGLPRAGIRINRAV